MNILRESKVSYAIIIVLSLCIPTMCLAQPSIRFPTSVQTTYEGATYRSFDLGNFRALLQMDADLTAAIAELELRKAQIEELTQAIDNSRQAVLSLETTQQLLQAERDRLTLQWQETDEALQNCENKPRVAPFLASILAVTFGLVSVGLGTYIAIKR